MPNAELSPVVSPGQHGDVARVLQGFQDFSRLPPEDLIVLACRAKTYTVPRGKTLFKYGDNDDWLFCLVDGEVQMEAGDGKAHVLSAIQGESQRIISRLQPRRYTATALTSLTVVQVDSTGLGDWQAAVAPSRGEAANFFVQELPGDEEGAALEAQPDEASGFDLSITDYSLPSLPAIALQAKDGIDSGKSDARSLGQLLLNDPAITAKLLKVANSAMFGGNAKIASCERAIVRLGLNTTRHLVVSFAVGEVFDVQNPVLAKVAAELWEHSTEVAAISCALAQRLKRFDPGEAQLAGLVHDIGVIPILHALAGSPAIAGDRAAVRTMAAQQRSVLTEEVLKAWNFPPAVVMAGAGAEDWWRDESDEPDLADLVMIAQVLSSLGKPASQEKPPMVRLPAFRKLFGADFAPQDTLKILAEADEQIRDIKSALRS